MDGLAYGPDEKWIRTKTAAGPVDCYDPETKRIIEFYGDYWHGNPAKYLPTDLVRDGRRGMVTVADKTARDNNRVEELRAAGYSVLIVWENDYVQDPAGVVAKCVDFMWDINK